MNRSQSIVLFTLGCDWPISEVSGLKFCVVKSSLWTLFKRISWVPWIAGLVRGMIRNAEKEKKSAECVRSFPSASRFFFPQDSSRNSGEPVATVNTSIVILFITKEETAKVDAKFICRGAHQVRSRRDGNERRFFLTWRKPLRNGTVEFNKECAGDRRFIVDHELVSLSSLFFAFSRCSSAMWERRCLTFVRFEREAFAIEIFHDDQSFRSALIIVT